MNIIQLIFQFFKIGLFTYGGGLAMLPLFQEIAVSNQWMTKETFINMIAISQSTPGPLAINMATFVGFIQFGPIGSFAASYAVVIPGCILSYITSHYLEKYKENKLIKMCIKALKMITIGLVMASVIKIGEVTILNTSSIEHVLSIDKWINWKSIFITLFCIFGILRINKSPLIWIICSAVVGIMIF